MINLIRNTTRLSITKTSAGILLSLMGISAMGLNSCAPKYYTKTLTFPSDASIEQKVDMAARLIPDARQRAWQDLQLTAFLHFGMNTFTGREWGEGDEDPALFNPSDFDADQWVRTLKDAGFRLAIITAKHHDGFCLWPTATTSHSVASSPWRGGKGDVVRNLADACRRHGLKLGIYLSPWDRNAPQYGTPEYNDLYAAQLTELLTRYGTVDEVWFDGACGEGPNGKIQTYDWPRFYDIIHSLQPDAVTAIMGHDVRWVGNEGGRGRDTEWSATVYTPGGLPGAAEANRKLGLEEMSQDLGSRSMIAKASRMYWYPSEVDVSIRPGWFFHENESPKSLRELAEIYLNSVGRNSVLLLNIPPDRTGRINAKDVAALQGLRQWIDRNFSHDRVQRFDRRSLTATIQPSEPINAVMLSEDITKGQRIESFVVEGLTQTGWTPLCEGTTIGYRRILQFPTTEVSQLRLRITSSRATPHLSSLKAYRISLEE